MAETLICVFVVNVVPVKDIAPLVEVKLSAPVVSVKPLDAVRVPDEVRPPAIVCAEPKVLKIKFAAPPASGMVYTREAAGAGAVNVMVFVAPNIN